LLKRDFGFVARAFAKRYFEPISFPADGEARLSRLCAQGEVVHVMRSAGALSFLFLAWALLWRALPPLRAVFGLRWTYWSPFRRLIQDGSASRRLASTLDGHASALVFLRERRGWVPRLEPQDDPFFALISRARTSGRPLFAVPILFIWRNRARNVRPGIRDFLFGSPEAPGLLLTAWSFLLHYKSSIVRVGEPIELTAFVRQRSGASDAVLVRLVRGALYQHLARETRTIVGPPRKEPDRIIEETLRDRTLKATLAQHAAKAGEAPEAVHRRAERELKRIAARFTPVVPAISRPVLSWIFTHVHSGVELDEQGLQRALATARDGPLIFCPSHKSHLDYLLMTWVMIERGYMPPLVASGANLSFWPLGPFLRGGGGFFLRRSFKGDPVYTATFKAYVKKLLSEGYTQEFFIEGTRSRTGKLLSPKLGLLSFIVDAFLEGAQEDVSIVPVAIDYEQVLEAKSYAREQAGGEKKPESIKSLLTAPKVLTARYGRIYLTFEEPISLRQFLLGRVEELSALAGDRRRSAIRALAQRITFGISRASTVTPVSLLAAALLAHRGRGISAKEVGARIQRLLEIARFEGARLSPILEGAPSDPSTPGPLFDAALMLKEKGLLGAEMVGEQIIYTVPEERRGALCFYKNNLVHLVFGRSFVAFAVLSAGGSASQDEIRESVLFLARLLKLELSFPVGTSFDGLLSQTIDSLIREGLLARQGGLIQVLPDARSDLAFLRDLIRELVESYRAFAATLGMATGGIDRKELIGKAMEQGRADFLSGMLACAESLSRTALENALMFYLDEGALVELPDPKKVDLAPGCADVAARAALVAQIDRYLGPDPRP
jgi:glycerol-3-phosphate O-acyltransferase